MQSYWFIPIFFVGMKVVFWDLREPFIDNLYRPNVSQSRLEALIEQLDLVCFTISFHILLAYSPHCFPGHKTL